MADISVTIKSNVNGVIKSVETQIAKAMEECGLVAVGHAQEYVPRETGNLAGSITHEVGENEVAVGTNVEYGPYVEFNEKAAHAPPTGAHYLKRAISNHIDEYQQIIERELRSLS